MSCKPLIWAGTMVYTSPEPEKNWFGADGQYTIDPDFLNKPRANVVAFY